jgi:spermidine/putrescine-binding protein
MRYVTPRGGSSIGVDPIGLLRGAPHPELAREFIEWVLSVEGQKLWNWKVGTPGGPEKYALRRLPIRRELYAPEFRAFRSDPDEQPYEMAGEFVYRDEWTGPLFRVIQFVIRAMCIDPHDELRAAWSALIKAGFPPEASRAFNDVSKVGYGVANGRIRDTLRGPKIDQVKLAKELSDSFRAQYLRAAELARAGK